MPTETLHHERRFSAGIFFILAGIFLVMAGFLVAQLVLGPLGSKPAPTWLLAVFTGVFLLPMLNFAFLTLTLTTAGVRVAYGVFSSFRRWDQLTAVERDAEEGFYGWGIRFGKYRGQWVWVYNTIGGDRVAFVTTGAKPRGLLVTTADPERVVALARERLKPEVTSP